MRTQSIRLAMAALLLLAGTAAIAAQSTTIVGTIESKSGTTLEVMTEDGLQTFSTQGMKLDPTLGEGDAVRVTYVRQNGTMTARNVGRLETVTVTLSKQSGVENLIVDEVETGSLSSLAGMGNIKAKVMMSGNNRVTIRTADTSAPVVAFRSHVPKGTTGFQTGEDILIRVPSPPVNNQMTVNREPVGPPARAQYQEVEEPETEPVMSEPEPEPEMDAIAADPKPVLAPTPAAPMHTNGDYYDEDRLPQTASNLHLKGLIGLGALACALGLGLARKLW